MSTATLHTLAEGTAILLNFFKLLQTSTNFVHTSTNFYKLRLHQNISRKTPVLITLRMSMFVFLIKAPQPTYFGTGQFGNTWRHHTSSTQQVHHASRDASREKRRVDSLVERRTGNLFKMKYRKIPPPLNYEIKIFPSPIQLSRQTGPFSGAYMKGLRW